MNKVIDKIDNKEIVVFPTDKSKKFSVDIPQNYINDMQVHIQNHKEVSDKYVNSVTKKFNDTSKGFVKIVQIGKKSGQVNRALGNVHVPNYSEIPTLRGLHKDHKEGRKKRAVVNGNVGPVAPLSNIISKILEPYLNELKSKIGKTVENTEELISAFEKYNQTVDCSDCDQMFIASIDVESLYPSLKVDDCSKIVKETIMNSNVKLDNIDTNELLILLRKMFSNKELREMGFYKYIPF